MPQLDCFSYWHQLVISILLYFYIFTLIAFFYAPTIFLRPRLTFLMNFYSVLYVQFIINYIVNIFTLRILTFLSSELLQSFVFDGFKTFYLFHKNYKRLFYALYFVSLTNYNLRLNSKFSNLTTSPYNDDTPHLTYSQTSFVNFIF